MDIYRGVKVTFMLPVLLTLLLFLRTHGLWKKGEDWRKPLHRVVEFLDRPLNLKALAVLGIFAFVAWVFIGRSGPYGRGTGSHGGTETPVLPGGNHVGTDLVKKIHHRPSGLSSWLPGRPGNSFPPGSTVCASRLRPSARGSLVQTFCHMRTPILMSYVRALDGYVVGVVAGLIAVAIFAAAYPHVLRLIQKRRNPVG